jgi:hypothetical protein
MTTGDVATADDLAQIVRSVLLVARLGEADHRGWWGTRSFGAAGRVVLKQRLPRTWRMAAAELDLMAAAHRHDEIIERRNAVHLFSDNWPVHRWTAAWVAEQKTASAPDPLFEELEAITPDAIASELRIDGDAKLSGQATRLGSVDSTTFDSPADLLGHVQRLVAAYAQMDSFTVPYLEVGG